MHLDPLLVTIGAAFLAGAINSVAGGGSFMSFPALILAGVPPISANATNNAAMWVGTFGGARGYWNDVRSHRQLLVSVLAVSSAGALIGALLLLATPVQTFARVIPWLILFATVVFAISPRLVRSDTAGDPQHQGWQLIVQFFIAVYGGYFGAGMGILMLAVLTFSGLPSFNATNGMKNVLAVAINGIALIPFLFARIIDWHFAIPMAVAALTGGYFGAKFFRRVPARVARAIIILIGTTMTIVFFTRR
ncbi:MAG: sulfite exporter TauE/SafE family protein [Candidatus Eremiobacteraeota bacterium]|nr:sulfite exporter TauE/SafE family protein [Candidatus Eremiobacteraeota bacterium]